LTSRVAGSALKTWRTCSATWRTCCGSSPEHAEHDGVADRRPVLQALHTGADGLAIRLEQLVEAATTRSRATRSLVMTMT
jgi:hypothetical protein